jgi:hypothetical protein
MELEAHGKQACHLRFCCLRDTHLQKDVARLPDCDMRHSTAAIHLLNARLTDRSKPSKDRKILERYHEHRATVAPRDDSRFTLRRAVRQPSAGMA